MDIRLTIPSEKLEEETKRRVKNILNIVENKEKTSYDLFCILDRCKGIINPVVVVTDDGLSLLQYIIEKGRLSLLAAVVQSGWWKSLVDRKAGPGSVHQGRTVKQMAQEKRVRKPLDEFVTHHEWNASLTPLMKACSSQDFSRARQLAESQGRALFNNDYNGNNCLYWAVVGGDLELFEKLVNLGNNVTMRNNKGETLLHVVSQTGRYRFVGKLLNEYKLNPLLEDVAKKTALDRAAEAGDIQVLSEYIKWGTRPQPNALALSAYAGRSTYLKFLLEHVQMDLESVDIYSRTALHRACEASNVEIVKYLLKRGASLTSHTAMGRNLLHIAAETGNMVIMDLVIDGLKEKSVLKEMLTEQDRYNGIDLCFLIRGRDKGRDAFHYAEVERFKVSIFMKKTKVGNVDIGKYGSILKSGWGSSPSQDVVDEIEEIFMRRRLNMTSVQDMTPLHVALAKGHPAVAKKLVELGADVHARDKFGLTPILLAASKGDLESVNMLEKAGANNKATCTAGHTMKDLAEMNEHENVVNFAASEDACVVAQKFRTGPLDEIFKQMSQLRSSGLQRNKNNVHEITYKLRDLAAALEGALREIGSGPVQQPSDSTESTQPTDSTITNTIDSQVESPASSRMPDSTRTHDHRSDTWQSSSGLHSSHEITSNYAYLVRQNQMLYQHQSAEMLTRRGESSSEFRYLSERIHSSHTAGYPIGSAQLPQIVQG